MKEYRLIKIKNHFPDNTLKDVKGVCRQEMRKCAGIIKKDMSVAIGVGSRGIDNLENIVREVIGFIQAQGAHPFIIPAMGSHGGATSEGQQEILTGYGITEKNLEVPVRSSMEVVEISGSRIHPVFMDKLAFQSDGVILINKIKPHTDFHGTYESGLVKMAVVGLGKEHGAQAIHKYGVHGLVNLIQEFAKIIFASGKILAGIAIVENAYDRTMIVKAVSGDKIMQEEADLIHTARLNRPVFPVNDFDVLLIDRMGKNISGAGVDTNIIGRIKISGQPEPVNPSIRSIVIHDLTDDSHGNATGVGLADVITRRLFDKINFEITYKNITTSTFLERGKIPIIAENDLEAFELALRSCNLQPPKDGRIIRIKDTLHLGELYVSEPIFHEIKNNPQIESVEINKNIYDINKTLLPF